MEGFQELFKILEEPLVRFFLWVALIYVIANVFVDRKIAFWIGSLGATYFWIKNYDQTTVLKAWGVIGAFMLTIFLGKVVFNLNPLLLLKGKKRCPMCCEEVYRKAKVCPHCHHRFREGEECDNPT